MVEKIKVLFVCVHNSARSQIAESFIKQLGGGRFEVESAGLEPTVLNPLVVDVMKEIGIDISNNKTKSAFDLFKQGKRYQYVISVCDEANAQRCPIFPGLLTENIHWSFEDPASFQGSYAEKLVKTRQVRDEIKSAVEEFIKEHSV
jgi:arsenate reductase